MGETEGKGWPIKAETAVSWNSISEGLPKGRCETGLLLERVGQVGKVLLQETQLTVLRSSLHSQ